MTEIQDTKEIKQDHTSTCKSVNCKCDYKDLPKTCNIRLHMNEMEIKILESKIKELQMMTGFDDGLNDESEEINALKDENKKLSAEITKLKKQLEKSKPGKKSKKPKDDEDDD